MARHGHMGTAEIAALLGVSRQRVHQLRSSYPDFPAPADQLAVGPVWHAEDVKEWLARHRQRPTGRHRAD